MASSISLPSFANNAKNIVGSTDGAAPAAGSLGELRRVFTSAVSISASGTPQIIASITLDAGIWDISSWVQFSTTTALTGTRSLLILSASASASSTPIDNETQVDTPTIPVNAVANLNLTTTPYRLSISAPTTYKLNVIMVFSGGTPTAAGVIRAIRVA